MINDIYRAEFKLHLESQQQFNKIMWSAACGVAVDCSNSRVIETASLRFLFQFDLQDVIKRSTYELSW